MNIDNKLESLMKEAIEVSTRSKDSETRVGAILIAKDDCATIATGYNGFVRGAIDSKLPTTRPEKYPYMRHAEENILTHCARRGIATKNTFLVITLSPCTNCLRMCFQAGIDEIYFKYKYRDFDKSKDMMDLNVKVSEVFTNLGILYKINLETYKESDV